MLRRGSLYVGLLLVLLGGLLVAISAAESLFASFDIALGWVGLWPLLVLYVAAAFWLAILIWWPRRRQIAGLVVPGTVIGVNGLILLYQSLSGDWDSWVYLWALEPVSVGLGLLFLYWLLGKRGLLIAAVIVSGTGMTLFIVLGTVMGAFALLGPVLLIVLGVIVILRSTRRQGSGQPFEE